MLESILHRRGTTLVRRLILAPGEATLGHRDPFQRVSVMISGDALAIEYRDGGQGGRFEITMGQTDWDEPTDSVHRALNVGKQAYEEIAIFFLERPDAAPEPEAESA